MQQPEGLPERQGLRGRNVRRSRERRPGSACSATRDCSGGNFCDGVTGVCTMGGGLDTGASCTSDRQCAPPLRCSLTGFYGTCAAGGDVDLGGACPPTPIASPGLWCGANGQCAALEQAFPPFAGVACADDGRVPRLLRGPARRASRPRISSACRSRTTSASRAGALDISDFPKPGPTPLGVDLVKLYVDTWTADFDGFSAAAGITFRFSGQHRLRDRDRRRRAASIDVTAGPTFGHGVLAQLGHQQRAHQVLVQPHAGRAQHRRRRRSSPGTPTR